MEVNLFHLLQVRENKILVKFDSLKSLCVKTDILPKICCLWEYIKYIFHKKFLKLSI